MSPKRDTAKKPTPSKGRKKKAGKDKLEAQPDGVPETVHEEPLEEPDGEDKRDPVAAPEVVEENADEDGGRALFVVGIGASAGGLEAIEQFFRGLPAEIGAAYVIVQHFDPDHRVLLGELLQRHTERTILTASDGMSVQPEYIYIIPPRCELRIEGGFLRVRPYASQNTLHMPIDVFLRSLAEDRGERSACVILSGTGTDGTLGLTVMKERGGLTLVQTPDSAKFPTMPQSAINTDFADLIVPPQDMGPLLIGYIRHARAEQPLAPRIATEAEATKRIFAALRKRTGHDFSHYKQTTIRRRIQRRMNIRQFPTLADYAEFLERETAEQDALFRELLISVTHFFRDPDAFEQLKEALTARLHNRDISHPIRVWVAGCATGEEAYSVAIVLRECIENIKKPFQVQIFATDIDSAAISKARSAIYPVGIEEDVSEPRLRRYFTRLDENYQIKRDVRDTLVFAEHSIIHDPPFSRVDVLVCRNLLIYLDADLHRRILPIFHYALNPDGLLFLGSAESVGEFGDLFTPVHAKAKLFSNTGSALRRGLGLPMAGLPLRGAGQEPFAHSAFHHEPGSVNLGRETERLLLDRYTSPCVLIDAKGEILYVHGRTGKFLEPSLGLPRYNVLDMAREGLRVPLSNAIRKALIHREEVVEENLTVRTNGTFETVALKVSPVRDGPLSSLLLVMFCEGGQVAKAAGSETKGKKRNASASVEQRRVAAIETELKVTREHLETTIEELRTSNEELMSSNEELQSSNEELASTNEELETSKEELQSVNEELVTVNTELQQKIDELSQINDDMSNLLANTGVATLYLDNELRIQRFNPSNSLFTHLILSDIGRPIGHMALRLQYDRLSEDAREVLATLIPKEQVVRCTDGLWYVIRMLPYRTRRNVIEGVVVTFTDITKYKQEESRLLGALATPDDPNPPTQDSMEGT